MRSFLRSSLFLFIVLVIGAFSGNLFAQVNCVSASTGGSSDSSDIGRFVIGTDTFGHLYSHLGDASAVNSYILSQDTLTLYVGYTYHVQEAGIMNTIHDADAKFTMFIDYNGNQSYDLPGEMIWASYATAFYKYVLDTNITIPTTVVTDSPVMMRLILNNDTGPSFASDDACGTYVSGETIDMVVVFRNPTSVKSNKALMNELKVGPNPSTGKFVLSLQNAMPVKQLELNIMSVTEQKVFGKTYTDISGQFSAGVDMSAMPKGLYFIETNADGERLVNKIVIE